MRTFLDRQVRGGEYHKHSQYVRDLIRQDQRRRAREQVDALLLEGLASGEALLLTVDDWREIREQVRSRARRQTPPEI